MRCLGRGLPEFGETYCSASGPVRRQRFVTHWAGHSLLPAADSYRSHSSTSLSMLTARRGILACAAASIQGSTDIPTLFDLLPGYLPMPLFREDFEELSGYIEAGAKTGWWANDKYIISLPRPIRGRRHRGERLWISLAAPADGDHSHMALAGMLTARWRVSLSWGQPGRCGSQWRPERRALSVKWMVNDLRRSKPHPSGMTRQKPSAAISRPKIFKRKYSAAPRATWKRKACGAAPAPVSTRR